MELRYTASSCSGATGAGASVRGSYAGLGLRICDDLSDVALTGRERHHPVDPGSDPSVGRGTETEGAQQEGELLLRFLGGDPECSEHLLLRGAIVDPDAPAGQLPSVESDVVRLRDHLPGIVIEILHRLFDHPRERMVDEVPSAGIFVPLEPREIRDPHEAPRLGRGRVELRDQSETFREVVPEPPEHLVDQIDPRIGDDQQEVSFGGPRSRAQSRRVPHR